MIRFITRWCALGFMVCVAAPAEGQAPLRAPLQAAPTTSSASRGELRGVVEDEKGKPVSGAVVSAVGATTLFTLADAEGRFVFRNLVVGAYLVRAHLQGYASARARLLQVTPSGRPVHTLSVTRAPGSDDPPAVLTAGVGATGGESAAAEPSHDHDERAWRMRHAKRSVLKGVEQAAVGMEEDFPTDDGSWERLGRAFGSPARLASLVSDLPLTGQIDLLTSTAFDRPQDLFELDAAVPHAVAYMALQVPGRHGQWLMRGTITQGDLSSWVVSGAYRRAPDATHAYEAGLSYSTQSYVGGNTDALRAMADGRRNVGSMYAYDNWALSRRVRVGYGAEYARYHYLDEAALLSPRASVTFQPLAEDPLKIRALVSHRETAPGAAEFTPSTNGLWLPPERTFSHVSRSAFRAERLDHIELAAERELSGLLVVGVRAFRQKVEDQLVTVFGVTVTDAARGVGHYHVGSAGDFSAQGWGVSVSRPVADGVRASVDYTQSTTVWTGRSAEALTLIAPPALRASERLHDFTATVDSAIAPSATRVFVIYKVNTGFAGAGETFGRSIANARFNVQVNQSLPFLRFANANWEMLAVVSNLFGDDPADGSVYEEALVLQPPKRIVGGVTVRF